jgi:hypothetical protein
MNLDRTHVIIIKQERVVMRDEAESQKNEFVGLI